MIIREYDFDNSQPQKTVDDFIAEIQSAGLVFHGPFNSKQFNRCHDSYKPKKNLSGWYIYNDLGDIAFGSYGSWIAGSIGTKKWCNVADKQMSHAQKRNWEEFNKAAHEQQEAKYREAAEYAQNLIDTLPDADPNHPYIVKKQIKTHGVKQDADRNLIIPIYGRDGAIVSVQRIKPNGWKGFMKDGEAGGGFYQLGKITETILIAEGFATAATLHEITGLCTITAFAAGNIPNVTKLFATLHPRSKIIVCADKDKNNAGINAGNKAVQENNGVILTYPVFKAETLKKYAEIHGKDEEGNDKIPTDFNDLAKYESPEAVLPYIIMPKKEANESMFYIKATDIEPSLDAKDFVQGVLMDSALSVVYGESNCGKTFFMTDLAFHVALGKQWRDRRVTRGGVIYVALEGAGGLKNRVAAFKQHYGLIPDNFAIVPCHVDFMDPDGNINDFINLIEQAKQDIGNIKLVVIDTLARAMAGGDENSGQDMGMLVKHADMIRSKTGAHVSFVHHSGKDKAKGARGHSALRAAIDTEIEIDREKDQQFSKATIVKQRDGDKGDDVAFALKQIVLGKNQYEEDVTSCVVVTHEIEESTKTKIKLSDVQEFVYDSIVYALSHIGRMRNLGEAHGQQISVSYEELRETLEERGFKEMVDGDKAKSLTQTARIALKKKRYINFNKNYIWLMQ
jgi:phage/plasmid primase-like uncharacterized protein